MKAFISIIVSVFLSGSSFSQGEIHTDAYRFESWNIDWQDDLKEAYIFADACKLRSKPTSGSEVLTKLLIGDKVKILSISAEDTTINGIQSRWVEVESGKKKGYVWGGLLTNQVLKMTDSTSAVWGISRIVKGNEDQIDYYASLRIFSKKQITKQLEFQVTYGDDPGFGELKMVKNPLLDGVEHIFVYSSLAEACGVAWSEHYILETHEELAYLGAGYGMGEAALFHTSNQMIFPTKESENDFTIPYSRKPDENQIFKISSHDEYDEKCIWNEHTTIETFEWKDGRMVPFCRQ